jgi:hypothetical protein
MDLRILKNYVTLLYTIFRESLPFTEFYFGGYPLLHFKTFTIYLTILPIMAKKQIKCLV